MSDKKKLSQKEQIRKHLEGGNEITPRNAIDMFKCWRLSGIIHLLIHDVDDPMDIINLNKTGKNRFARYKLKKEPRQESIFEDEEPKYKNPFEGGY